MQPTDLPLTKENKIRKGYTAFTDGDWETLQGLLHPDVVWHPMDHGEPISGRDGAYVPGPNPTGVLAYLQQLRNTNDVELKGIAIKGQVAIAVDFTQSSDAVGDHGCADRIEFDEESDLIKEVWHCQAATHEEGHGHPVP